MLSRFAASIFGEMVDPYLGYFEGLRLQLKRAGMTVSLQEYLSSLILVSAMTFVITLCAGSFFLTLWFPDPGYTLTLSAIMSPALSGVVFAIGYFLPSLLASSIKSSIDKSLPFAAFYMTTSASSGMNPVELFRILGVRGGVIGQEAQKIYTNIKTLGMDIGTALQKAAARSPSPGWSDLLWGMASVISAGGDLEGFLKTKTESLMAMHRRKLNEYSNAVSIYSEIYMTLVIVGTLFFIVLMSIISPMVGASVLALQTFIVFFLVPLTSLAFIVIIKSISPFE